MQACWGPGEVWDIKLALGRGKLPCSYSVNANGTIDYWEEHACDSIVKVRTIL